MTNVLPAKDQKRVWAFYRTRFILVGSISLSILAGIVLIALIPSYVILVFNRPTIGSVNSKTAGTVQNERSEALKTQVQIAQILPIVSATSSPVDALALALDGKPTGVSIDRISYIADANQRTITLGGSAQTRDEITALRTELQTKGIYSSVSVPVNDLIGTTGNQFTVTLVSKVQ